MPIRRRISLVIGFLLAGGLACLLAFDASAALSHAEVKKVQEALKAKGHDPGPADGSLGPRTRAAIQKFQRENDLRANGQLDEKTLDRLGVKIDSAAEHFAKAGKNVGQGAKELGKGSKEMGRDVKEGKVGEGGKELGEGAGRFGKKVGEGAKEAAKGVKEAVKPDKESDKKPDRDAAIKKRVQDKLAVDPKLKGSKVGVEVKNGVVTLSGHLNTADLRDQAIKTGRSVPGVKDVVDKIHVGRH